MLGIENSSGCMIHLVFTGNGSSTAASRFVQTSPAGAIARPAPRHPVPGYPDLFAIQSTVPSNKRLSL